MLLTPALQRIGVVVGKVTGPAPPGSLMLRMQNAEAGVILEPFLGLEPAVKAVVSALVLLIPGIEQSISKGVTAAIGQLEIKLLNAADRCIGAREDVGCFRADEAISLQIPCIEKPGIQRKAGW